MLVEALLDKERLHDELFSFKDACGISHYCPRNSARLRFSYTWMRSQFEMDWPLLLLAIGAGYIKDRSLEFALEQMDGESSEAVSSLAIMSFEQHPDLWKKDALVREVVAGIDLEDWALAYEKLFYLAVLWEFDYKDESLIAPRGLFDGLEYDFGLVDIDSDIDYPSSAGTRKERWFFFLGVERERLRRMDFHEEEYEKRFEGVLEAWRCRSLIEPEAAALAME